MQKRLQTNETRKRQTRNRAEKNNKQTTKHAYLPAGEQPCGRFLVTGLSCASRRRHRRKRRAKRPGHRWLRLSGDRDPEAQRSPSPGRPPHAGRTSRVGRRRKRRAKSPGRRRLRLSCDRDPEAQRSPSSGRPRHAGRTSRLGRGRKRRADRSAAAAAATDLGRSTRRRSPVPPGPR